MKSIRTTVLAALAAFTLISHGAGTVVADEPSERRRAEEMAREAMERILQALELFMQSIPQYELPEVNEHGDIIIRRKRRPEPAEPDTPESNSTRT